jgi:hypothetical protein
MNGRGGDGDSLAPAKMNNLPPNVILLADSPEIRETNK